MKRFAIVPILLLVAVALAAPVLGAEAKLQAGDYVAVIGDSITEQKLYSMYIEDYLLMCKPAANLQVTQFGWGGETAPGFAGRVANDCLVFKPTAATTCYGMNDGGYSPMDPGKAKRYRDGQKSIVDQLKKAGVRLIAVGSPGVVDADTFRNNAEAATMYNKTLAEERDIAKALAEAEGCVFANVFDPMMEAMTKAKAKYGKQYHVAGGDGSTRTATARSSWPTRSSRPWGATATSASSRSTLQPTRPRPPRDTRSSSARAARSRSKARATRSASTATRRPPAPRRASSSSARSTRT
jgi:lysophospholipase L1-like esterase